MSKGLQNWISENKETIAQEKEQKKFSGVKSRQLQDGENVLSLDMEKVTSRVFTFNEGTDNETKSEKFFYWYTPEANYDVEKQETYPLLVPKSVHYEILDQVEEYGEQLQAIKVKRSGSGKSTEYKVFAVLKKGE